MNTHAFLTEQGLLVQQEPWFKPVPATDEKLATLSETARQMGFGSIAELLGQKITGEMVWGNIDIPTILKRYIEFNNASPLSILREMRHSAVEQQYATRALAIAKDVLRTHLPECTPTEATVPIMNGFGHSWSTYMGKFAGSHIIALSNTSPLTTHKIAALDKESDIVSKAVHELIHPMVYRTNWPGGTTYGDATLAFYGAY